MMVDAYSHIQPELYLRRLQEVAGPGLGGSERIGRRGALRDVEQRLAIMKPYAGYVQVLTLSAPPVELIAGPELSPELARLGNDELAGLVDQYPDKFVGFAAGLPMNNVSAALREIDRAVEQLGAIGVQIFSNVAGAPLDAPEFVPLFDRMARLDLPIWLHPTRDASFLDYSTESRSKFDIWWAFGWPYETTAAMTHLVFSGVFQRRPELKVITHHCGAMAPFFEGRIRSGLDRLGTRTDDPDDRIARGKLSGHPVDHFRLFYADTAVSGSVAAIECGLAFFGPERVLFGTDMPFGAEGGLSNVRDTIEAVNHLNISEETRRLIYEGNARRILRLRLPANPD